jgi:hypothetical protein
VTDPAPPSEPLRFYRSFTVGPDFATKLASTSFRHVLMSPAGIVRVAVVALAFAVSAYVATVNSNGPAYALSLAGIALVVYAGLIAVATLVVSRIERHRMRQRIPAGTEFAVGFRENTILMRSPMDTAEVEYSRYQSWQQVQDFVMLQQQQSRILNFLPAECFTPESLAYLREKLGPPANSKR